MIVLRKKAETTSTITLEWDPVPGAIGYRFQSAASQPKWTHTFDAARRDVKFSKAAWYKVEALGVKDAGQYPQATPPGGRPPLPPGDIWSGPLTVTQGGTYEGAWASTSGPSVTVQTTQPVSVTGWIKNLSGAPLIAAIPGGNVQLTVENMHVYGGYPVANSGRFIETNNHRTLIVRNCTITYTRGIEITWGIAGGSVLITKNKHHNMQSFGKSPVGNFVQLREVQNSAVEISWNQITNDVGVGVGEDLISVYKSSHCRIHDNWFGHHSTPGNAFNDGTQGAVTIESPDGDILPHDNETWNNQFVDCAAVYGVYQGHDNSFHDNRVIRDGYLPNGVSPNGNGYDGLWIAPGVGANNHVHDNVVGYMGRADSAGAPPVRRDGRLLGAPEGDAAEWQKNTRLSGPITRQMELDEWPLWQAKLAANGITLGA